MFIPKFVSLNLRAILINLAFGFKREGAVTHDLHEHFANGPMPETLRLSEKEAIKIGKQKEKPRKIVRSRSTTMEAENHFRKEMAA